MEPGEIQCKLKVGFVSGVYAAKQGIMFNLLSLLRLSRVDTILLDRRGNCIEGIKQSLKLKGLVSLLAWVDKASINI